MARILVVDDEPSILELLKVNLERDGYAVETAADGVKALEAVARRRPDLVLLDVMLPGLDGLAVCRELHQNPSTRDMPIIMLSARREELDKILGLEMGADDYVTKPFSPRELLSRVKARLRRNHPEEVPPARGQGRLQPGRLVIDPDRYVVLVDGEKLDLTRKEFELLRLLATLDVHICYLRRKMGDSPGDPGLIRTVRGVGYSLTSRLS
ncbi:MAG: response regulator transcription factor [Peptococcaceae bacterium]|nr:response regulator transcription factor [Peptococcaceae bacterium]